MISKKDNLLVRPWQQRKFAYHRQKVQSALPAIDTGPPPFRAHVCVKLKKQQKEMERSRRIEQDNYLLMQRLNYVMRTSRVDNMWKTPQPNFLNRVALYDTVVPELDDLLALDFVNDDIEDCNLGTRKSKCYACAPEKNKIEGPKVSAWELNQHLDWRHPILHPLKDPLKDAELDGVLKNKFFAFSRKVTPTPKGRGRGWPSTSKLKIPEERIPWEPDKQPVCRIRSKSVPVKKSQPILPAIEEQVSSTSKPSSSKSSTRLRLNSPQKTKRHSERAFSAKEPQSITLNRGCLRVSINFPSDTIVKFQEGNLEKYLMRGVCHCKNSPSARVC